MIVSKKVLLFIFFYLNGIVERIDEKSFVLEVGFVRMLLSELKWRSLCEIEHMMIHPAPQDREHFVVEEGF